MRPTTPVKAATAVLLAAGIFGASAANAASVSYFLDQTNTDPPFSDGTNYLIVTIDDNQAGGLIRFTVDAIDAQFNKLTSFGIQNFAFNITVIRPFYPMAPMPHGSCRPIGAHTVAPPPQTADGFGQFEVELSTSGAADRQDPLVFSIDVAGDTINSYFAPSTGGAVQGNAWFAAHVAGFTTGLGEGGCTPINGTTCKEVTSAWFGGGNGE